YTFAWSFLGVVKTTSGLRDAYQLVITRNGSGEEVYRSRASEDFLFAVAPVIGGTRVGQPQPHSSTWPSANGQFLGNAMRAGNGGLVVRDVLDAGNGGDDTVELSTGISLSDLTIERLNNGTDLRIRYSSTDTVTIVGQGNSDRAIETLQLRDGLAANLLNLRLVGDTISNADEFIVGDANANALSGLGGDDVISGGAGND